MSILLIIIIFVVGFLCLYAAYRYGGDNNIMKYVVYIIVMLVFVFVLLDLAGVVPFNFLNRKV